MEKAVLLCCNFIGLGKRDEEFFCDYVNEMRHSRKRSSGMKLKATAEGLHDAL